MALSRKRYERKLVGCYGIIHPKKKCSELGGLRNKAQRRRSCHRCLARRLSDRRALWRPGGCHGRGADPSIFTGERSCASSSDALATISLKFCTSASLGCAF